MTAREKILKIETFVKRETEKYKKLFAEDLKSSSQIEMAMDREATKVLTRIKMILKED